MENIVHLMALQTWVAEAISESLHFSYFKLHLKSKSTKSKERRCLIYMLKQKEILTFRLSWHNIGFELIF